MNRGVGLGEDESPIQHQKCGWIFRIDPELNEESLAFGTLHWNEPEWRFDSMPRQKSHPARAHVADAVKYHEASLGVRA
jgi:hypothetical protein